MWKYIGIGCGLLLVLAAAVAIVGFFFFPHLFHAVETAVTEEKERQTIAEAWAAPDPGARPLQAFSTTVGDFQLDSADSQATIPELTIETKGLHAVYESGKRRIEVFAYPMSKPEAKSLIDRINLVYEHADGSGSREWFIVDHGESYMRVYFSAPGLGQNHLWFTNGWLLIFRTRDTENCEGFVRQFLKTPRRGKAAGKGP